VAKSTSPETVTTATPAWFPPFPIGRRCLLVWLGEDPSVRRAPGQRRGSSTPRADPDVSGPGVLSQAVCLEDDGPWKRGLRLRPAGEPQATQPSLPGRDGHPRFPAGTASKPPFAGPPTGCDPAMNGFRVFAAGGAAGCRVRSSGP
jgi:hypothetical protein